MRLRPFGLYCNACLASVRVAATFSCTVLFPLLYSLLPFFSNTLILFFI